LNITIEDIRKLPNLQTCTPAEMKAHYKQHYNHFYKLWKSGKSHIVDEYVKQELRKFTQEDDDADTSANASLTDNKYQLFVNASGGEIKQTLQQFLNTLKTINTDMDNTTAALTLLSVGCGAFGTIATVARFIARFMAGAYEDVACLGAITDIGLGVIVGVIFIVVILVLIPLLFFVTKEANCTGIIINDSQYDLLCSAASCHHGKVCLQPFHIDAKSVSHLPGVGGTVRNSNFYAVSKSDDALVGVWNALEIKACQPNTFYKNVVHTFDIGTCIPLTGDNNINVFEGISCDQAAVNIGDYSNGNQTIEKTIGDIKITGKLNALQGGSSDSASAIWIISDA